MKHTRPCACRRISIRWLPLLLAVVLGGAFPHALQSQSSSTFFGRYWSARDASRGNSAIWGDADNDGDLDLMVISVDSNLRLYRNLGTTLSTTAVWESAAVPNPTSGAWADVDGDGYLDLAVGAGVRDWDRDIYYPAPIYIFLNNKAGALHPVPDWTSTDTAYAAGLAFADSNGDKFPELAVAAMRGPNLVFTNNGGTLSPTAGTKTQEADDTHEVVWADINNDGRLDLTAANEKSPPRIYLNNLGRIPAAADISIVSPDVDPSRERTHSIAWGDVDNDGDLDLAVGNEGDDLLFRNESTDRIYRNNGNGSFTPDSSIWDPIPMNRTRSISWHDVDADGDLDLMLGNYQSASLLFLNQNGKLANTPAWATESDATMGHTWGDVDGDGDLDLAVANWGVSRVYANLSGVLQNQGQWAPNDGTWHSRSVAWGDVDRDGDLDLAVAHLETQSRLYRNDNGTLGSTAVWRTEGLDKTMVVAWGDVDGDGYVDLAAGGTTSPTLIYYRNANGTLSNTISWSSDAPEPVRSVAWGDMDNDGDLDLAVATAKGIRIYVNENNTLRKPAAWSQENESDISSVAWGDMDQDGDLDLAAGHWGVPSRILPTEVYRNEAGVLSKQPIWSAPRGDNTTSVNWADIDGDGDLDLITGDSGQPDRIYGNTNGVLSAQPVWSSVEAESTWKTAVGDVDGDGDLDLVATSDWQNWNRMYRNDGGTLTAAASWKSADITGTLAPAWGDVDGDGDLDLAAARYDVTRIYFNQRSQLAEDNGTPVIVVKLNPDLWPAGGNATAKIWSAPVLPIAYTLYHPLNKPVARITAYYSLDGGGSWKEAKPTPETQTMDLTTASGPAQSDVGSHVFLWDIAASGVMGQSDNVVLRLVAVPSVVTQPDHVAGPFHHGSFSASTETLPFRLRGTQVRVLYDGQPQSNALVYRLPAGAERNGPVMGSFGLAYRTDSQGYLQGRGDLAPNDRLLALLPVAHQDAYDVYYTNLIDVNTGMPQYVVTAGSVQTVTVSADNPLILFNLDVALEWDGSKDAQYLSRLEYDLGRTSEFLYNWTDGQAALGKVRIFNDARRQPPDNGFQPWLDAHIRIYASNAVHPSAIQGGIVTDRLEEPGARGKTIVYTPGMVHIGAVWNRYGESGIQLGEDWPRGLAHELGHYVFFLDDNYVGQDVTGNIKFISAAPNTGCPGVMNDPYSEYLAKFHPQASWLPGCADTFSHWTLGRSDWESIVAHYPWLKAPAVPITALQPGPSGLRLALTEVTRMPTPVLPGEQPALDLPIFTISRSDGGVYQPGTDARAYLLQGARILDLGAPVLDQINARGARSGDRLCLLEPDRGRGGCVTTAPGIDQLVVQDIPGWQPQVIFAPLTAKTLAVTVTGLGSGLNLQSQVFPRSGDALPPTALTPTGSAYGGEIRLPDEVFEGHLRIWDAQADTLHQVITDFVLGSNPQRWDARDAQWRTRLARWRATSAPVISAGGRVSVLGDNVDFGPEDWVFSLQAASTLPDIPSWAAVIGQGYWLHASPGAPDLRRTMINFVYDGRQVSPDQESLLRIYFRRDGVWTPLPTQVNYEQNFAAAPTQGPGLYALILAVEVPLQGPGWNIFAYTIAGEGKAVADALKTITGLFTAVYAYEPTDADPWRVFDPAAPAWVNDLTRLEYGKSYLIYATESTTLHPAGGTGPGAEDGPNNAQATALAPPAVLYGTIPATGTEAYAAAEAAGQIIAWIDGRNCGAAQTAQIDNTTVYAIEVASEVNVSGCGAPGQTVRLTLDGKDTGTTAAWDNTRATQVIAGQGGGKGLYLPYIER